MSELQQQVDDLRAELAGTRRRAPFSQKRDLGNFASFSARRCPGEDLAPAPRKACHPFGNGKDVALLRCMMATALISHGSWVVEDDSKQSSCVSRDVICSTRLASLDSMCQSGVAAGSGGHAPHPNGRSSSGTGGVPRPKQTGTVDWATVKNSVNVCIL